MVFLLTLPRVPTTAHKTWPRPISLNSFQLYALCSLGLIRSRPCCSLSTPNPLLSLCLLCMPENLLHQYLDSSLPHSILTSAQLSLLGELTCFLATQCLLLENVVSLLKFYCVHLFLTDHNLELKRYSVVVSSSDSGVRQKSSSTVWLWAFYLTSLSLIFLICKMRPIIYFTITIRTKKENMTVSTGPENKCSIGTNFLIWVWLYSVSFWGDNGSEL